MRADLRLATSGEGLLRPTIGDEGGRRCCCPPRWIGHDSMRSWTKRENSEKKLIFHRTLFHIIAHCPKLLGLFK